VTVFATGRAARSRYRVALFIATGVLLGSAAGMAAVRMSRPPHHPIERFRPVIEVPRAAGEITVDGELGDPGWAGALGRTGAFTTDGRPAHPYSDARFVQRGGQLFVVLYAADEDIRATTARHDEPLYGEDAFQLTLRTTSGEFSIDVSSAGIVTDARRTPSGALDFTWESHARVVVDRDGTTNDPSDQDEEWVVEMAIPLDALGLTGRAGERIELDLHRCDDVPNMGRVCAGWGPKGRGGTLVLGDADIE
jgi:hypothetical protein